MRMRAFCHFIEKESTVPTKLNNAALVVDAQNYLYRMYRKSDCQSLFGSESDVFVKFLKNILNMFRKSNVKCFFIFKGGHEDVTKRVEKVKNPNINYFEDGGPIFLKDIYLQVLEELGLKYVICECEAKEECIAMAQKYDCAILSYDVEFCFAGVKYIPYSSLKFNWSSKTLKGSMFTLDNFLKKFKIDEEKLAILAVLNDENFFPEDHFLDFFKSLKIPLDRYGRYGGLLRWLSFRSKSIALRSIFRFHSQDKEQFLQYCTKVSNMIRKPITPGLPCKYLESGIEFEAKDPDWFKKGVITNNIPPIYVNIYKHGKMLGSWVPADADAPDALVVCMEIAKYAYDLLTNFANNKLSLIPANNNEVTLAVSLEKPKNLPANNIFENGWMAVRDLKLFEHFVMASMKGFDFDALDKVPLDARLLIIAIAYFRKKAVITDRAAMFGIVYGVLLSYACLTIMAETEENEFDWALKLARHKGKVARNEKDSVRVIFENYSSTSPNEARKIFDRKLIHPLVEFQHILEHMNFLNTLCGHPYSSTNYGKTYNSTFVYKTLLVIKNDYYGFGQKFLKEKYSITPRVKELVKQLIYAHKKNI